MFNTIAISKEVLQKVLSATADNQVIVIKQDGNTITSYNHSNKYLVIKTFNNDEAAAHTAKLIQQGHFTTTVPQEDCGTQAPNYT